MRFCRSAQGPGRLGIILFHPWSDRRSPLTKLSNQAANLSTMPLRARLGPQLFGEGQAASGWASRGDCTKQHFLYFRPLPHGQGVLRPNFGAGLNKGMGCFEVAETEVELGGKPGITGEFAGATGCGRGTAGLFWAASRRASRCSDRSSIARRALRRSI